MNYPNNPTFSIKTFGCKVNQYETQSIKENLIKNGFKESGDEKNVDFFIVNSCTVTKKADKDTRHSINAFHRLNPKTKIVIAGCYAESDSDRKNLLDIPGVFALVRNSEKSKIVNILSPNSKRVNTEMQITDFEGRDRAFIKIQDGCNHKCSYCKVSIVRGASVSRKKNDILNEVQLIITRGFKEIVLTGICLGAWGKELKIKEELNDLIEDISKIKGTFRIRLSSIEPLYITKKLVNTIKNNKKVCKHLHMPLQSGDDSMLRAMNRPYSSRKFAHIVKVLRKNIPNIAITTDIIVGFPGERDKSFNKTLKFVKRIKPSRIHVFSYSKRDGTKAAKLKDNLDKKVIKERVKILINLSKEFSMDFAKSFVNKSQNLIVESQRDKRTNLLTGYTDRYIRLFFKGDDCLKNKLVSAEIISVNDRENMVLAHLDNGIII